MRLCLQQAQEVETSEVFDIGDVSVDELRNYTGLVVGAPTWNTAAAATRSGTCWDDVLEDIRMLS